ncbi:MAG: DUF3570 domain-containing protein [Myxococcota bacterium]|nr:DUF3570 domain-containing protein [Myxococcota bacterium]
METEHRLAVVAAASDVRRAALVAAALAFCAAGTRARAQDTVTEAVSVTASDAQVLERERKGFRVESVGTRITSFDQYGHGYQSQAGPIRGPGSERTTVLEPQLQVVVSQGDNLRHVLTVPVDIITAASPDAIDNGPSSIDVVSGASRHNVAGTVDWAATYRTSSESDLSMNGGLHLEEPLRSWHGGLSTSRSFADGDTVVVARAIEVFDWFDRFDIAGHRHGRADRTSTTGSIAMTQIVTPTTVMSANYGLTVQQGELGNTWNSVPLAHGDRGPEVFPGKRVRHALVARSSQFLPWNGALRLYYRLYGDDWGVLAHSFEAQLMQRLSAFLYVGALYRFHTQTGVDFFTPLAPPTAHFRTADSDLAPLDSHTLGGKVVIDVPIDSQVRALHFEVGYERYFRTNDLHMDIFTCATGYSF